MTILDVIILAILIIGFVFGFIKGVKKSISKLGGIVIGIVIACIFYSMLSNYILNNIDSSLTWSNYWSDKILANNTDLTSQIALKSPYMLIKDDPSLVKKMYEYAGVPSMFSSFFVSKIFITNESVSLAIGSSIVASITYLVTFICLFIVTSLIVTLLIKFVLNGFSIKNKKGIVDRLVGGFIYLLISGFTCLVLMLILVGVSYANTDLANYLSNQVNLESNVFSLSRIFYNLAWQIINIFIK